MTRRRYIYRPDPSTGELVPIEVSQDFQRFEERVPVTTDLYMDGVKATDGADIGSRKKRREYMNINQLADADDYKGVWAKAAKERAQIFEAEHGRGHFDTRARKGAVAKALYQLKRGRR